MIEDQLRDQLRRVDDLTPPPAPDFAARAMGASARHVARRRTWGRAVLGAAAAIAIGTLTVTTLSHQTTSGSATSDAAAGAAAPEAATNGATQEPLKATTEPDGASLPGPSSTANARLFTGAECASTLTGVRAAVPALQRQGLPVISAACDPRGVVVLRVGTALTAEQRGLLAARYGARLSVADRYGTPLP